MVEAAAAEKKRGAFADFLIRLVREKPLGTFGAAITLAFLLTAIFSDFLAPYGMNEIGVVERLTPPGVDSLLGSDHLGRDVFSRVIHGARISVIVGLAGSTIGIFIATLIGGLSGYIGGRFDTVLQRFVDAWMAFPSLIILILAVTVIGPGLWQVIILLGFVYGFGSSRIVRGAVISIKESEYMEAARAMGCSNPRMLIRHILPNIMAPIIILYTTAVPWAILEEAALSFIGLGIPPPTPSWGGMLSSEGRTHMLRGPWLAIWPGLALSLVVYGVNMFGDALRDLLDPRLRGSVGHFGGVGRHA